MVAVEGVDFSVIGLAGQYAAVDENPTGRDDLRMVGALTHQPRGLHAASELKAKLGTTVVSVRLAGEATARGPARSWPRPARWRWSRRQRSGHLEPVPWTGGCS